MLAHNEEISHRYLVTSTDDLLRIAGDRESLTIEAREALAAELRRRGLDRPEAVAKYEHERDQEIQREEVIRRSKRSRFQKGFDWLKEHPVVALLVAVSFPAAAFLFGNGMVTLKIGNGRILAGILSLTLAFGDMCSVAVVRSSARLPIRIFGFVVAIWELLYAFGFLFGATVGFR